MELFARVIHDFSELPCMGSWDEAKALFQHAASRRPDHWLTPVKACEAAGGTQEKAVPAMLAVGCAHVGILLIDDMLDDDPRGDYHRIGMPAASNLACAFQAAALHAISQFSQEPSAKLAAMSSFNEMFLITAFGQYLDVQSPKDEFTYWQVAKTKSSSFFGAALQIGAFAGGGKPEASELLKKLGCLYGEMIQIHDDMHDSMETPANPDWVQGRSPLPILFASLVRYPEQARFLELKEHITESGTLQEAQEILIRCGAISYCADQIIKKHKTAKRLLDKIPLVHDEPLSSLLDQIIAPIHTLLEACDA